MNEHTKPSNVRMIITAVIQNIYLYVDIRIRGGIFETRKKNYNKMKKQWMSKITSFIREFVVFFKKNSDLAVYDCDYCYHSRLSLCMNEQLKN